MRPISRILRVLFFSLLLITTAYAAPPPEAQQGADLIRNLMTLVSNEFIYKTPPAKLYNGAASGLEAAIKAKKLPAIKLQRAPANASREQAAKIFTADYYKVAEKYPKLLKEGYLQAESMKGMLKVLDDQYTVYMSPKEYNSLKEAMNGGNFGGLGVYIELDKNNNNALTVVEPIEDTPASRAGLQPKDVIVDIDGNSTTNITVEGAQKLLRGPVGSKVKVTIKRPSIPEPLVFTMERDRIRVNSVSHKLIEQDGHKIGYLKLRMFGDYTNPEMEAAIRDLESQGAEAHILDLRNNGGGYITAAVDVCSKFLPTGSRVVSVEERGEGATYYESHPNMRTLKPLVMLVNEYSASASEITAGCMKDLNRAKLVGVKTFGKGSVQKIFPLPDGSALKVTTAHYHTPSGKDINKLGIEPDIKVEMQAQKLGTKEDAQMQRALAQALEEVKGQPAASKPGQFTLASIADELRVLQSEQAQGFTVTNRKIVRQQDGLFEDVLLRRGNEEKTIRFDLSRFLGN